MVSGVTINTLVPESLERMTDTDCRLLYLVTDFSIRPLLLVGVIDWGMALSISPNSFL